MENKPALDYLKTLIDIYSKKQKQYYEVMEHSYSGFLDYLNVKEYLLQLKYLYYKLTDKEFKDNESK